MSSRFIRVTLAQFALGLRGVLLLAGCAWATWIAWPPTPWSPPSIDVQPSKPAETVPAEAPIDIDRVCRRNLRQPLTDAPAPVTTPAPEQPLAIRLVGTAVEPDRRFGVFLLANNTTVLKEVGTSIDGYELIAVERGLAQLRRGERKIELRVPRYEQLVSGAKP